MNALDQKAYPHPYRRRKCLKMLVSAMMTGHDDGNHADGPIEMATWDVSKENFYGEARRWIYTYLPEGYEQRGKLDSAATCTERETQGLKDGSMKVGTACLAFCCSQDGHLKGLCHGHDFCVVARRKQLQICGNVLEKAV